MARRTPTVSRWRHDNPAESGGSRSPDRCANATLRTWISRLRQRYRDALRTEVASTVSNPAEIDDELKYLYRILVA